jgi:hypothetical protein
VQIATGGDPSLAQEAEQVFVFLQCIFR